MKEKKRNMEENQNNTQIETEKESCCGHCGKKINYWKGAFLVVLLFLAVSLVYVGYQFSKLSQKPTAPVSLNVTPTPLPAEASVKAGDPTANWKTYTNSKYLFSIKIPPDWYTKENLILSYTPSSSLDIPYPSLRIDISEIQTIQTNLKSRLPIKTIKESNPKIVYETLSWNNPEPRGLTSMSYTVIGKRGELFLILNSTGNYEKEMDQILSTFKFLE